jgi:hypothetical protein
MFGRSTYESVIASNVPIIAKFLRVPIRFATYELEGLLAALEVAKGYHEYQRYQERQEKKAPVN